MIVSRYLTREVLTTTCVITLFVISAFLCQQGVRYLNYVAIGKVPVNILFELLSFEAPYLLALLLPLGLYLGILITFGRMHVDHELAILKMSGFGQLKLMKLMLYVSAFVSLVVFILMIWVNPFVSAKRESIMKNEDASQYLAQTIMPGRFQVSPDGRYVMYVEALSRDRQWTKNVFLAQEAKSKEEGAQSNWMLVSAEEGYLKRDPETKGFFFVMQDGYRYEGVPGQNDFKIAQFQKYAIALPTNETEVKHVQDEGMSTYTLWQEYKNANRAAELQWRLSISLTPFLLALLAVALSALQVGKSRFIMLIPAILIYIFYMNLLFVARRLVEQKAIPIIFGMWWVHGILLLIIAILLWLYHKKWAS